MDGHRRDWKDDSEEDCGEPVTDIFAILAADIVVCGIYVEEHKGGWCDDCACQLKYHCTTEDGECELCGCYEIHHRPTPVIVLSAKTASSPSRERAEEDSEYDRSKEARRALKDLTE